MVRPSEVRFILELTPVVTDAERIPCPGRYRRKLGRIIVPPPDLVLNA